MPWISGVSWIDHDETQIDQLKSDLVIAESRAKLLEQQVDKLCGHVERLEKAGEVSTLDLELQVDSLKDEAVIADNKVLKLELQADIQKDRVVMLENELATSAQPGWQQHRHVDGLHAGRSYYYNRTTGVGRWRRPEEPPLASKLMLQVNDQVVMLQNELATSAQPSTHLPLGWTHHQDDDDQTYDVNRSTCNGQWERPEEPPLALNLVLQVESLKDQVVMLQNELATSAQPSTHLPLGWTQHQDDDDQTYYVNRATCTSQWERPEVPPHAFWLASMPTLWKTGLIAPTDRAAGDCAWHCAQAADGNVARLSHVVGEYNTIKSTTELWSLFTSMEVTLFRQDRQCWTNLQAAIEANFQQGKIVILNGKPKQNKWIHITCCRCGAFVYSPFGEASSRHADTQSGELRRNVFKFFMIEHRAPDLHLLPEV